MIDRVVGGEDAKVVVASLRESRGKEEEEGKDSLRGRAERFLDSLGRKVGGVGSGRATSAVEVFLVSYSRHGVALNEVWVRESTSLDRSLSLNIQGGCYVRQGC